MIVARTPSLSRHAALWTSPLMPEERPRTSPGLRVSSSQLERLTPPEIWWRDHRPWLAEHGYALRPRYQPDWKPSWKGRTTKLASEFEDYQLPTNGDILDAVRVSDNNLVALKRIKKEEHPFEVEVAQYLYSEELRSDPRNHTIPLLDVLAVPDDPTLTVLVMPLMRACGSPRWDTVGEVIAFVKQALEGLQFMHEHHVAHRDCMAPNIMYDPRPMYPQMYHPQRTDLSRDFKRKAKHTTRTARPVKYYFIDFGLSRRYSPEDGPPREHPIQGGDKSVPEFKDWKGDLLDPFPTDIYYIGNMVRTTVLQRFRGLEFMNGLVQDMVRTDPSQRPTIQEVTRRFDEIVQPLSQRTLRSRLVSVYEPPTLVRFWNVWHGFRTLRYILLRKAAIPVPP
ncbi:hypothetical protein C8Q80DRAFT_1184592, partial [Daedaleopsis nitida]